MKNMLIIICIMLAAGTASALEIEGTHNVSAQAAFVLDTYDDGTFTGWHRESKVGVTYEFMSPYLNAGAGLAALPEQDVIRYQAAGYEDIVISGSGLLYGVFAMPKLPIENGYFAGVQATYTYQSVDLSVTGTTNDFSESDSDDYLSADITFGRDYAKGSYWLISYGVEDDFTDGQTHDSHALRVSVLHTRPDGISFTASWSRETNPDEDWDGYTSFSVGMGYSW